MKRWIENLSIKNKLIFIVMSTVSVTLVLLGFSAIVSEQILMRRSIENELATLAKVTADRSTVALAFMDVDTARESLSALALDSKIILSCIYDADGVLFAAQASQSSSSCPRQAPIESPGFAFNSIELIQPIQMGSDVIGRLYIKAGLMDVNRRVGVIGLVVICIMLLSALLAYWIASKLQTIISRPILELADFTRKVSTQRSYQKRIETGPDDEVGQLRKAFNEMLEQIHTHIEQVRIADERWQYALEGPQDGVWDYNCETGEVFCSGRLKAMLGFEEEEDVLTRFDDLQQRIHKNDQAMARFHMYNHYSGRSDFYTDEHRVLCKNGVYKWILDRGKVISRSEDSMPLRMIGTFQDVSKRKLQEEQLRRSQKMDAVGKLSGGIAHDYNNMLGIVLGYAELLDKMLPGGTKQQSYVQEIIRASRRSSSMTQKLLGLSGTKTSTKAVVNINTEISGLKNVLEKTLTARIRLKLELEDDLPPVLLDVADLENAIINLCFNSKYAIDQTQNEEGELIITTAKDVKPPNETGSGSWISLRVTDNGCGMDTATKAQIFDPFYSTKGQQGTGLGLSQVYGFMQRSEGVVAVDSEEGRGTTITLFFPCCREEVLEPKDREVPVPMPKARSTSTENILVVDDELELLKLTCEILQQYRYTVWPASNSQQALAILSAQPIDLVLTDIIMPDMNGYELASIVRAEHPGVKIKMMSGFNDQRKLKEYQDLVGEEIEIIYKPIDSKTLLHKIREALKIKEKEYQVSHM